MRETGFFLVLVLTVLFSERAPAEEFALKNSKIVGLWTDAVIEKEFLGNGNLIHYFVPLDLNFDVRVEENDPKTWNMDIPQTYNADFWETWDGDFQILKYRWSSQDKEHCWLANGGFRYLARYADWGKYITHMDGAYDREAKIKFFILLDKFKNLRRNPSFKDSPFLGQGLGVFRKSDNQEEYELLSDGRALLYHYEKNRAFPGSKPFTVNGYSEAMDHVWLESISIETAWWKKSGESIEIWNVLNDVRWENRDRSTKVRWARKFGYNGSQLTSGFTHWNKVDHSQIKEKVVQMQTDTSHSGSSIISSKHLSNGVSLP